MRVYVYMFVCACVCTCVLVYVSVYVYNPKAFYLLSHKFLCISTHGNMLQTGSCTYKAYCILCCSII